LTLIESPKIETVLPDIFTVTRPIVQRSSALIVSANLLHLGNNPMLPIVEADSKIDPLTKLDPRTGMKMYASLGGYSVLNAILRTDPKDYAKLLWKHCEDFPVWRGSVKFTDTIDDLLKVFEVTKLGDAAVEGSRNFPALVTLQEILVLFRKGSIKSHLRVSEIGTAMVSISSDSTIIDALKAMFENRIRRVFLSDSEGNSTISFVSDRHIIQHLFSPMGLERSQKDPTQWADAKLFTVERSEANIIGDGKIVNQAVTEIGDRVDDCLVCEDSRKVVSRWDIVMKTWKTGNFSFQK
jgi:CBS domain-containing protein